jgi:osmotically-inducible protein OsmY
MRFIKKSNGCNDSHPQENCWFFYHTLANRDVCERKTSIMDMHVLRSIIKKPAIFLRVRVVTNGFFILLLSTLLLPISGCVFVAGAAAGAAGVAIVYDHRKIEHILEDRKIIQRIDDQLADIPDLHKNSHIDVTSFNRIVLLTGQAQSSLLRQQIDETAKGTQGVMRVYNQITVGPNVSPVTHANDIWITTKIRTEMLATKNLASGSIKVVTENGSVYMMGMVTHDQANIAVDIARRVSGVSRVVKIFHYTG